MAITRAQVRRIQEQAPKKRNLHAKVREQATHIVELLSEVQDHREDIQDLQANHKQAMESQDEYHREEINHLREAHKQAMERLQEYRNGHTILRENAEQWRENAIDWEDKAQRLFVAADQMMRQGRFRSSSGAWVYCGTVVKAENAN